MKYLLPFRGILPCAALILSLCGFGQLAMLNVHSSSLLNSHFDFSSNKAEFKISGDFVPRFFRQELQPTIQLNQLDQDVSLINLDYDFAQGPSLSKSVRVDGFNLNEGIVVKSPAHWEISSNGDYDGNNQAPFSTVKFFKNASNKNLYIRLKSGLPVGIYKDVVTFTSPDAITRKVTVSGSVLPGKIDMKVFGGNNTISNGSSVPSNLNLTRFKTLNIGEFQPKIYTITNKGGANLVLGEIYLTGINSIDFSVNNAPVVGTQLGQNESVNFEVLFRPTTTGIKTATVEIENNDPHNNPYDFAISGKANFCGATSTFVIAQQGFEEVSEFEELSYTAYSNVTYGLKTGFSTGKSAATDRPSENNLFFEGQRGYRIQGGSTPNTLLGPYILDFKSIDTSIYTNLELSIKIAGFSLGNNLDGMDNLDSNDVPTTVDGDKLDFVLIEVSPDNGSTWFQQAKVVSDRSNLAWGFGYPGRVEGDRDYEPTNSLTYFKSAANQFYKKITILNVPAVPHLKIRISAQNNSVNESWIFDDVQLVSTGIVPKVWNGNTWLPSKPLKSDKIIINGNYDTATSGGSLQACQCEVNAATLTISENDKLVISDIIVNNGNIVVKNNANLIQVNETAVNSGNGTFTVIRNANLKRVDYTYWASPVTGQNLKQFSNGTLINRFYTYNESNDLFEMIDPLINLFGNSQSGFESGAKGYAIRANNNYPSGTLTIPVPSQKFEGVFRGSIHNGFVPFPLQLNGNGYNLVGNPYPSDMDFYSLANNNKMMIDKTAYFWTNLNPNPKMQGSNYPENGYFNNYAILNGTGGIPATLGASSTIKSSTPTNIIKVGQGFIVKAKQEGTLTFKNAVRNTSNNSVFLNKRESVQYPIDRYWLHLTSPLQVTTTTLIGYIEDATNDYDPDYDAALFGLGADALFTELDGYQLGIQGKKAPLSLKDDVHLGTNHHSAGDYTFSLGTKEGVFAKAQNIYLKDNQTGIITNLLENNYTYTGVAGLTKNRFEIVYESKPLLGLNERANQNLMVYRNGNNLIVESQNKKINEIEMYDASGRLIYRDKTQNIKKIIPLENLSDGIYILKINRQGEVLTKKVLK